MVLDKAGVDAEINVIDDLTSGAYDMPDLELDEWRSDSARMRC